MMNNMFRQQVSSNNSNPQATASSSASDESRIALFNALGGSLGDSSALLQTLQAQRNERLVEALAASSSSIPSDYDLGSVKRKNDDAQVKSPSSKKHKKEQSASAASAVLPAANDATNDKPAVPASDEGLSYFNDNDVLSGRGGGTNVHPGNRHFRDLINLHRRAYLKARKNDKPQISRTIVKAIRDNNGRFLKRDESSGLWYEIGDDAAREKTSQALRQRAPEMRKILFESEREQARQEAEEQLRQQQQQHHASLMEIPLLQQQALLALNQQKMAGAAANQAGTDPYTQNLMTAALLGGGINRFTPNGA